MQFASCTFVHGAGLDARRVRFVALIYYAYDSFRRSGIVRVEKMYLEIV
jgi:hypothetical protein